VKPSREQLEAWIAGSERVQKKLRVVIPVAVVPAAALFLWSTAAGGFGLLIVGLVAICGYWITSSHLAEWQGELDELDNPAPKPRHAGRYER
jgi:hypothetical protein